MRFDSGRGRDATRRSREGVPDLAGGQSKWAFMDRFPESGT